MEYHEMTKALRKLGIEIWPFRKNIVFRHFERGFELDVTRDELPRKNATPEQCQAIYDDIMELMQKHTKVVNTRSPFIYSRRR